MIDIAPAAARDMVREELKGDDRDDGLERGMNLRQRQDGIGERRDVRVPRAHEGDDDGVARLCFPEIRRDLLVESIVGSEADHRQRVVEKRDGAMLHLAARITLRVQVRDLLELERAFEGDRVMSSTPQEEHVTRRASPARNAESTGASSGARAALT